MGAALGAGDGVDLVDDDRLDPAQGLAGLAGEHQEERLGRRDEDVGGSGAELATVGRTGVSRPQTDPHLRHRDLEPFGRVADAGERGAQVALDVDRQRLQRGDVEDAGALQLLRAGLARQQGVDGVHERAQGLATTGGSDDERVPAGRDRVPRTLLGGGRTRERCLEPRTGGRAEAVEGSHAASLSSGSDSGPRPLGWSGRSAAVSSASGHQIGHVGALRPPPTGRACTLSA